MKKNFILFILILFVAKNFIFADETDKLLLSIVKNEVQQYGKMTDILEEASKSKEFVIKMTDSLVEALGIKQEGYYFSRVIEDENNMIVVYKKDSIGVKIIDETKIVYTNENGTMFLILIDKNGLSIEATIYF